MDCSRRRAPCSDGGFTRREDETMMRLLLLDAHGNRAKATGNGGCVARVEWSVKTAGLQFLQRRDDNPRALAEVSTATQSFIVHKNIFGDVEEHYDGSPSRRVSPNALYLSTIKYLPMRIKAS